MRGRPARRACGPTARRPAGSLACIVEDPNAEASALIWEQARQQLAQQNADLDLLRTRSVAMLSVAALVAGLFGTRLPHGQLHGRTLVFLIIALALFAASVVLAVLVAAPRRDWEFAFKFSSLLERVDKIEARPGDVTRNFTSWAESAWANNLRLMQPLYTMFRLVCVLVGLQVIAWAIAVL
jgi:membrane-associated PAP2 superfamily phosphatase